MHAVRRWIVSSIAQIMAVAAGCGGATHAGGAPPSVAGSSSASPSEQTLHWSGKLALDRTIDLRVLSGTVRAVAATDDVAVIDATRSVDTRAPMRLREDQRGVTLRADSESDDEGCDRGEHKPLSVDVVVRVPKGLRLVVHTVDGHIDADGLMGPVDFHTVDGAIDVRAMTGAHARTVNGPIHAAFAPPDLSEDTELSTVNGALDVTVARTTNADLAASTVNGLVHLELPPTNSSDSRDTRVTLGRGGHQLRLRSVNGTIRVAQGA